MKRHHQQQFPKDTVNENYTHSTCNFVTGREVSLLPPRFHHTGVRAQVRRVFQPRSRRTRIHVLPIELEIRTPVLHKECHHHREWRVCEPERKVRGFHRRRRRVFTLHWRCDSANVRFYGGARYYGSTLFTCLISCAFSCILRNSPLTLRRAIPIYSIYCVLVYTIWIQAHSRFQPGRGVSGYSFVLTNSNSHFNLVLLF